MHKIALLDDWMDDARQAADWSCLSDHQIDVFHDTITGDALIERLQPYSILGVMRERTPLTKEVIDALPNLRAIITSGMRNASIDTAYARSKGIVVMGTQSPGHATAELAMILIGNLARQIIPSAHAMQEGGWQVATGRDLRGARLGILGLGRLGSEVAKFGQAFGMDVVAWSQNLTKERCDEVGVTFLDKTTFFQSCDFITIHLKLSERVRHLIDAEMLALMKDDAYLINTSRAPIIDKDALAEALRSGAIGGAAIDVYDYEPLPSDDPLRQLPNLIMTPHIGYVTKETMQIFYGQMAEGIAAFIDGKPIRELP